MTDLTLRNVKGSPLTNQEVDDNFSDLNADKYEAGDSPTFADVTADSVQLTGGTGSQGLVTWNADEETLDIIQNGATLQVGQEVQIHCRNNTGSTIGDGVAVYATGTLGNSGRITVAPMIANGTTPAKFFLGITTEEILNGEDGKVTTFGKVRELDTTAYTDGDVLYVSPTTAGALTATMPAAPNLSLPVAFVIHAHSSGTIFCRAYPLDENESLKAANNLSDLANAATARTNLGLGTAATTDSTAYATAAQGALADAALPASSYTAADVLTKVKTVDGAGSGLDADLLDGQEGTYYAAASSLSNYLPLTGGTLSGALDVTGTVTADRLTVDGTSIALTGATNPTVTVTDTTNGLATVVQSKNSNARIGTTTAHPLNIITNNTTVISATSGGDISFYEDTGTTAKFFWDASAEALLVGKTVNNDTGAGFRVNQNFISSVGDGAISGYFHRLTSDGDIVQFRKDGTTVGSIGANSSNAYISGTTRGLHFTGTAGIIPCNEAGAARDADTDIGSSSTRFKDLYLSGGVYLGGTGAANKLDDYEEGTWTPAFSGTTTNPSVTYIVSVGNYTKVGRLVSVSWRLQISAISGGSGLAQITGLPFAQAAAAGNAHVQISALTNMSGPASKNGGFVEPSTSFIYLCDDNGLTFSPSSLGTGIFFGTATYFTA